MIYNILIFIFFIPVLAFCQITGKVIKIKDGDTVVILDANNVQQTIRIADIDCPEYKQPFSEVAKQFTSEEVFGKNVYVKSKGKDRYGRIIGFIFYGQEKNLSAELLKAGLAWHYVKYSSTPEFENLENTARKLQLGLWKNENPVAPWNWRIKNHK